jgi:membrane protease YdiL (CAAX protease family)
VQHVLLVVAVTVASVVASYGFSRMTGRIQTAFPVPVGVPALVLAAVLTAWAPRRYGWQWGSTRRHWRLLVGSALGVVTVVVAFRTLAGQVPYVPSFAEVVVVPLGEEGLFRGFLLVTVGAVLAPAMTPDRAGWAAVGISSVAFGVGHLGNLGYVPTGFVLVQAAAATLFGALAGWVRLRTDSLAGPVILHAAMNAAAVL